ncbi:MAG: hypothetical protein ACXWKC_02660 [Xanthobacteraceae bacterium]
MSKRSERSARAQARAHFREVMEEGHATDVVATSTPLPSPPPQGGREPTVYAARGGAVNESLIDRARALYEDTVVPVREIARICGVTERTILKYAQKGNWKPRYHWIAGEAGVRHRRWRPTPKFAPVTGAGARFIRREDKDKPFAVGLRANDPAAAARAVVQCERARGMAKEAERRAPRDLAAEKEIEAIAAVGAALAEINAWRRAQEKQQAKKIAQARRDAAARETEDVRWIVSPNGMRFIERRKPARPALCADAARSRCDDALEHALWVAAALALARWEGTLDKRQRG